MLDQRPPRAPSRPVLTPRPARPTRPSRRRRPAGRRPSPLQRDLRRLRLAATRTLVRLHRRWGWRVAAVPVLLVVSVLALTVGGGDAVTPATGPATPTAVGVPPVARDTQLKGDDAGAADAQQEVLAADALPAGAPYTERGAGTFHVVPGTGPVAGGGPRYTYTVEVEDGIAGVDESAFAATVEKTLSDDRSWVGRKGEVSLQRVDAGPVSWRVTLTSAMTVRQGCGYEIQVETSCWAPQDDRVYLNVARWVRGDVAYIGDLDAYRTYMVNHENGHALGHEHVTSCLAGGLAPVMMQQTISTTAADGTICQPNPWPDPPGVPLGPDPRGESAPTTG